MKTTSQNAAEQPAAAAAPKKRGRQKKDSYIFSFRAGGRLAEVLQGVPNRTAFIRSSLMERIEEMGDAAAPSRRASAGQPMWAGEAGEMRIFSFRAEGELMRVLLRQRHRTAFIVEALQRSLEELERQGRLARLGDIFPATSVKSVEASFFDLSLVAGFPVPLDNDESSQSIDLLSMLCPYPESTYLIRVKGNSMIDANIFDGDIVVVDKSNRSPSPSQVAVCEFNGEYTLKRFERDAGGGWLVPANPDFPRIRISPDDDFSIWGTVTYVIHKPK